MPPGRRGKYLGFVAHEIKNPLATALWSCDLLKRMDAADRAGPRADKMIDASLRALRRMRRLVDDYFTMERLQEQGYELRPEPVELRSLVEGAISQLGEKEGLRGARPGLVSPLSAAAPPKGPSWYCAPIRRRRSSYRRFRKRGLPAIPPAPFSDSPWRTPSCARTRVPWRRKTRPSSSSCPPGAERARAAGAAPRGMAATACRDRRACS
ncbi:MAG: HAMP domain-containing histidine kinase [Deltaproteobacteria bacterium]|nr:MAG: HAMP domain-containing histidine kinase [Deltaproteobacteria bacterium]